MNSIEEISEAQKEIMRKLKDIEKQRYDDKETILQIRYIKRINIHIAKALIRLVNQ